MAAAKARFRVGPTPDCRYPLAVARTSGTARTPIAKQIRRGLDDGEDGWWVQLVLDAFNYLVTDFGYTLAEVQMHFRGNYIVYRGPVFELVIEYDPEDGHYVNAQLWSVSDLDGGRRPRMIDVNSLLLARDPEFAAPETTLRGVWDREQVTDAVEMWARGLRALAPDVLSGSWP